MHRKVKVRQVSRSSAEYKSTYYLSYKHEMPDRTIYFTQEAVENAHLDNFRGHVVESSGDWQCGGSISPDRKQLLRATIACGTLEKYNTEIVFEYEKDYD